MTVHENDPERGGCEFGTFFDGRTPKDLEASGIYNVCALYCPLPSRRVNHIGLLSLSHYVYPGASQAIAQALYSGRFWPVSAALVAKAMGATIATGSRPRSFTTASALRTDLRRSALCAAVKRVIRNGRDEATAAEARRVRRASFLYGWHLDVAQATRERPGRGFLRGPGSRRNTTSTVRSSAAASIQATTEQAGSNETARSDPGPSAGVETTHDPESLLATGAMQREPVQARVGYPPRLPGPGRPSVVRV